MPWWRHSSHQTCICIYWVCTVHKLLLKWIGLTANHPCIIVEASGIKSIIYIYQQPDICENQLRAFIYIYSQKSPIVEFSLSYGHILPPSIAKAKLGVPFGHGWSQSREISGMAVPVNWYFCWRLGVESSSLLSSSRVPFCKRRLDIVKDNPFLDHATWFVWDLLEA